MMRIVTLVLLYVLLTISFVGAQAVVEGPLHCTQCGMDRTAFAQSRMLLIYADGTTMGFCSLHCVAEEMQQNMGKQVRSLMVADYSTKELLDAKTATWVVGGKINGVMTALPKWAFAKTEDARRFVAENGGRIDSFDQALSAAIVEVMAQAAEKRAVEQEMLREQQQ